MHRVLFVASGRAEGDHLKSTSVVDCLMLRNSGANTTNPHLHLHLGRILTMDKQPKEHLLYQHVAGILIENSVKEVVAPSEGVINETEYNEAFIFEGENVHYH